MKVKTADLIGKPLDWVVADLEGEALSAVTQGYVTGKGKPCGKYAPSSDFAQAEPIIEREQIKHIEGEGATWDAWIGDPKTAAMFNGPTPLVAAMRCFVASKLGDEVDVPDEPIS